MRFNEKDFEENKGKVCYGRIRTYIRKKGYGFIRTENGQDLFFSSYDFEDKKGRFNACIGSIVSFTVEEGDKEYFAKNITIENRFPSGRVLKLPKGPSFNIYYVDKFGVSKDENDRIFLYINFLNGKEYHAHGNTLATSPAKFLKELEKTYWEMPQDTEKEENDTTEK